MPTPRFSIGIDLGTTNCALAFVPLDGEAKSEILGLPQWETLSGITESSALPSFLYLPDEAVADQIKGEAATKEEWIVGRLARKKAGETPGRVVHSAKSWLCHHTSDRTARFLPWGPDDIARTSKISPLRASALILSHLKVAWNSRFAHGGPDFEFDSQEITVTVPASFDAAAQRLTLMAAQEAGFPEAIRLLEEPQAALYSWLEQHNFASDWVSKLPRDNNGMHHVLVVDIGGGTSDFSLFEFRSQNSSSAPEIKRQAVGDHILLGGDNVDLAIAHLLEPRLIGGERGKLSGPQWDDLVARCRDLKEKALSTEGRSEESFSISLPGRGSGLVGGSRTAQLTCAELRTVLLDGFFPECDGQAYPYRTQAALKEWGLPYASDCAVTRHLAEFLRGRPRVDAILFNGGSLRPKLLRQRICQQIGKWQGDLPLLELENSDPDFAVARGAALFGKSLHCKTERIAAGAARAVFLEVLRERSPEFGNGAGRALVCVLPRGASSEQRFDIVGVPLEVQTNRLARFQAYYSARHDSCEAGNIVNWNEEEFHPLPPLETVIKLADSASGETFNTLPVKLAASANALGLLHVSCVSTDHRVEQSWPLEFNLRPHEHDGQPLRSGSVSKFAVQIKPNVTAAALEAARLHIQHSFAHRTNQRDLITATRLLKKLEQVLGIAKSEWNAGLVRSLWPALENCMARRRSSADHEEAWLILAGFLLRPGFGAAGDDARIDSLWGVRDQGLYFLGKRSKCQEYILWRRLAGGLTQRRQEQILAPELDKMRTRKKLVPELIRLAGSLERLPNQTKAELANLFIDVASDLAREKKHCAPYLAALGHILSRAPLYAGPETVVSPELVERAYETFRRFDWGAPELAEMPGLFLRAARVVGNRSFDLPKALRHQIAAKLQNIGVAPQKTAKLKDFMPVGGSERISLHDESLPAGLILTES
jgi:molecular chaperone DnaK (HSP70)